MIDKVLSFIAPHHCCGCDKIGTLLCGNCKYNINTETKVACIVCHRPTANTWLCNDCHMPYARVWVVGERIGALQRLIGSYKFERAKSAYKMLGDLLLEILPELPANTIVVPIPTVSGHIRERGYDHMLLIAKYVARARGLKCERLIIRKTNTKQRQATAGQRLAQAKQAFLVRGEISPHVPYLIIDDVVTTGATIKYAAKALRDAGAKNVWVAVIARQILEK
jgi:ComF family protein